MNSIDSIMVYEENINIGNRNNFRENKKCFLQIPIQNIKSSSLSNSNYEPIANEYYDDDHTASRNFDIATLEFSKKFDFNIPSHGFILELGAGKGCTGKYCKIESFRTIQIDISKTMLLLNPREDCFQKIRSDAIRLPIISSKFSAVTAFLYDPFNKQELYNEVYRILHNGGVFIGTLPHFKFCTPLREMIGYHKNKTRFFTKDERRFELDSFFMNDFEIRQIIKTTGFSSLQMYDLYLPPFVHDISKHIYIAASAHGLDVYSLPLVKLIIAKK